jgi:hypothetical protein
LTTQLSSYRIRLDAQVASRYKDFEKQVLQLILYDRKLDKYERMGSMFKPEDRARLVRAFQAVGLYDAAVQRRIDEHFEAASEAFSRVQNPRDGGPGLSLDDLFVLPLVRRTNAMVEFARKLDQERDELFEPLNRYLRNVGSFLSGKFLKVLSDGTVRIESATGSGRRFTPDQLASGEKQLLILLTEALLREENPVVYVADEPELSLHVLWQAKLLQSVREVGGRMQIIVATHSPDIVGPFIDKVIELSAEGE